MKRIACWLKKGREFEPSGFRVLFIFLLYLLVSCSSVTSTPMIIPTPSLTATPSAMSCTVHYTPDVPSALAAKFEGRAHVSGPADAPVTIVVFSHYQCPACAYQAAILKQLRQAHSDDLRFVYLHAPQTDQDKDALAIQAAEAADLQGKFWEMHDLLFEKLSEWTNLPPAGFEAWAAGQASGLGMDAARFQSDFSGATVAGRLQQALQSAAAIQSLSLPLMYVNSNTPYSGLADFASLDEVVRLYALTRRQFSACPAWVIDPLKQYIATLHTAKGDIVIQLLPDKAPLAVNNFVFLARSGWYDDITWQRVIPGFIAQTGDPSGTGQGNPGYYFDTEAAAGLSFNRAGMVGMVNSGVDTNGSQFFITYAPETQLDGSYTIFGEVLSGMDVLGELAPRDPSTPGVVLPQGDELISVTVEER
jgi:cyclophilin family peptidyl-prolyl cis-trans isomerase/protein-disulfide isomerase